MDDHQLVVGGDLQRLRHRQIVGGRVEHAAAGHQGGGLGQPGGIPERADLALGLVARAGAAIEAVIGRRLQEQRLQDRHLGLRAGYGERGVAGYGRGWGHGWRSLSWVARYRSIAWIPRFVRDPTKANLKTSLRSLDDSCSSQNPCRRVTKRESTSDRCNEIFTHSKCGCVSAVLDTGSAKAARLERSGSRSHQGASRKSITAWFSGAAHSSGSQWPQSGSTRPLTCVA
ncbi:hypothetical protein BUGL105410_06085 [Burkholderia gladioli]